MSGTESVCSEPKRSFCEFLRISAIFLRFVVNRRVQTVSEQIKCLEKTVCPGQKVKDGGDIYKDIGKTGRKVIKVFCCKINGVCANMIAHH